MYAISDQEFTHFQRFIFEAAGISLSAAKKALVCGRLAKRLEARRVDSYAAYFALLQRDGEARESQLAIDLLTTNETYFFREPRHFEVLAREAQSDAARSRPYRVWSAASSTGEEAYTVAMVLHDCLQGRPFEVLGTDISTRVLARARTGHYPEQRGRHIPQAMLKRYCLKGLGPQAGTFLVDRTLRQHVRFDHANLNAPLPDLGAFDAVFLRNVMIYFNGETKRQVIGRVLSRLKPGGVLFVGHSESLHGLDAAVTAVMPSVYRKT
ncbi:CheR family methyltransferase [Achromobacter aloeverae]|uniref:Chemotaxis protein methyltransferase n=1 Tax=Achromobacter aloeverae TaxID=1750518 RepID=A0A4Q1HDY4_9BURK|nr:protein-glutamate O-methyltransferase CheR [Achromobacter aloeverae]RXN84445.1 SAM-dependent methyltransferase [Achromobacter aloeverae]